MYIRGAVRPNTSGDVKSPLKLPVHGSLEYTIYEGRSMQGPKNMESPGSGPKEIISPLGHLDLLG